MSMQDGDGFPAGWTWLERGSALIRRMNSERIAEDPRLRRLLDGGSAVEEDDAQGGTSYGEEAGTKEEDNEAPTNAPPLATEMSFEQVEAEVAENGEATNDEDAKHQVQNVASHASRVLLWTYRVQASLQNVLQYALFAQASADGYLIPIAPRVYCVAPAYLTTFTRLFDAYASSRQWNAAVRVLGQLDNVIGNRFEDGACIFDCGLFDGVQRLHHKPLVFDELCDGRIASIQYRRGPTPSMHSAFIVASTVAAWLDLRNTNVAILMAPSNEQISVFATCCTLYCADVRRFPPRFPFELLQVYQTHIRGAESWPMKLSRTLAGADTKNVEYTGSAVPSPQARFVADFTSLLELRDQTVVEFVASADVAEYRRNLAGKTIAPAAREIYVNDVQLVQRPNVNSPDASPRSSHSSTNAASTSYRPYIVLQNEKGVIFSSMIGGVHTIDLTAGQHVYHVAKMLRNVTDLTLKMYHLPFGRPGELMLEARMHSDLLLNQLGSAESTEVTMTVANGDFDCISSVHLLPEDFALKIRYARDASAFQLPTRDDIDSIPGVSDDERIRTALQPPHTQAAPVRYEGPPVVAFTLAPTNVRTAFGDANLEKIVVLRRISHGQLELFALFYVFTEDGMAKVLMYQHLFRYRLPEEVYDCFRDMGATEDALRECTPPPLEDGLTFDDEFARWLQHVYDADLNNAVGSFDGEIDSFASVEDIHLHDGYRIFLLSILREYESANLSPPRYFTSGRGAAPSLIHQLPTYIFSAPKQHEQQAFSVPDCLICRSRFLVGEEIKSLPCFHAYHAECVDTWLQLNKVCPVCQCAIDCMNGA